MILSDAFGTPAAIILLCAVIAFLVSYALLVAVAEFKHERTFLAGSILALTVILIAASLVRPISRLASGVNEARHAPLWLATSSPSNGLIRLPKSCNSIAARSVELTACK